VSLFVLGRLLKSTPWPSQLLSLGLALALGAAAFAALGLAITGFIRSQEGSSAVLNVIVLPMAFLSGSFGETQHYPRVLRAIEPFCRSSTSRPHQSHLSPWPPDLGRARSCGCTSRVGAFGMVVAVRTFRWEPREG
jgi:ABC-2 type transport system permease protein